MPPTPPLQHPFGGDPPRGTDGPELGRGLGESRGLEWGSGGPALDTGVGHRTNAAGTGHEGLLRQTTVRVSCGAQRCPGETVHEPSIQVRAPGTDGAAARHAARMELAMGGRPWSSNISAARTARLKGWAEMFLRLSVSLKTTGPWYLSSLLPGRNCLYVSA